MIPIAIVGLNFGRAICDEIALDPASRHVRLAAVCDLDAVKAKAEGEARRVPWFDDLDRLLANPAIPAIGLYTGPNGRAALIRRCLAAGKHVMTTKPFERDPVLAAAVLAEAASAGLTLHANSPSPAAPDLTVIQGWLATRDLGAPVAAHVETWGDYHEKADGSWYDDPDRCPVPPIYRLGIYLINDLVALLGRPVAVQVQSSRLRTGRPTADNAQLAIRFAGGGLGTLFASLCVGDGDHYRNSLTVHCERGTIYRNVGPERGAAPCELSLVQRVDGRRAVVERRELAATSGSYEWATFAQAVANRGEPRLDPALVVGGLQVIAAMAESERTGREVAVA
jgi:predicted dehydrogenase